MVQEVPSVAVHLNWSEIRGKTAVSGGGGSDKVVGVLTSKLYSCATTGTVVS
jgi:hypothetical protein